ncbi:MAG: type I DNA topoisomerase [Patescibacteria group bacterium]|nr:type I DNA topoisomerase [Patescibacteria group bacterium]
MNNLVIVESPTKAKTIGKFLGNGYQIKASMGHVLDLPKSVLGVDVDHNFKPLYELIPDKSDIVQELQTIAKKADLIILATDPDREGEAIAAHVKDLIKSKKDNIKRIVFHEITKEAVEEALNNPRKIDGHLVDAQTARRVLDRLVGYKLSPLLWRKVRRGLSAGRVQSVALRLIVEREKEIEKFKKEEYYTIATVLVNSKLPPKARLARGGKTQNSKQEGTSFDLVEINGDKIELQKTFNLYDGEYTVTKTILGKETQAKKIVDDLKKDQFVVSEVVQKEMKRSPQAPYTTSTLQQDASRRLGLNGRKTMSLAQKLYEEGYITYHRTDSVVMATSAQKSIINFVKSEYGEKYLPESPRVYTAKQKLAQEAHEAIRPTKVASTTAAVTKDLGRIFGKLYEIIWQRAVASQMADAITESTAVLVDTTGSEDTYKLKASGSVLVFEGFLKVNPQALSDTKLPEFKAQEKLKLIDTDKEFHETPPPPRYNDASLIKTLEEKGIGRPSTYASIVSTIESRRYIEREEGRFIPTTVGNAVNEFLVDNFSDIDDIPFTALMEDELDEIADGRRDWEPMMKEFYKPFEKKLEKVKDAKRVKIEVEKTDEKCEKCSAPLVVRIGRFGKFLSCSKFPECNFTKPFIQETGFKCPKDGGNVIVRKTRKGRIFYGCSNYPNCDFATWKLEDLSGKSNLKIQNSNPKSKSQN